MPESPEAGGPDFWIQTGPNPQMDEAALRRHPDSFALSRPAFLQACVVDILAKSLGFEASALARAGILGDGQPIPLMSYALVEYLMGLDFSAFDVLELGGGNSTLFWMQRAKTVLTLEHDEAWLSRILPDLRDNVELISIKQPEYASRVESLGRQFDLIVIDCAANRSR